MQPMWITFAVALVASLLLTPLARMAARRWNVVDRPDGQRKLHKAPVPLWGGIAVCLALGLALLAATELGGAATPGLAELSRVLFIAAAFVCLLGCVDDSRDLNARLKLLLQIASVLPVALAGYTVDRVVLFGQPIELGWLGVPLTVAWLVGCINAINLLDGMDGLASTVGLCTAAMMAVIASAMGNGHVAVIAIALAGALAGFLVYNLPPASIYLGDSGSMVIGLVVGLLGIQGSLKTTATLAITAPAVVMTVPLLDTALAILRRRLSGRSIAAPDRGHIHHRLLERGLSTWQALCIIGALCIATGAAAAASALLRSDAVAWIGALTLVALLVRVRAFGNHELALVKQRAAGLLLRLLTGSAPAAATPELPPAVPLGGFDEAWRELVRQAARFHVRRLELRIDREGQTVASAHWSQRAMARGSGWQLAVRKTDQQGLACSLTAHTDSPHAPDAAGVGPLAALLRQYSAHWVADPGQVPTRPLRRDAA